MIARARAVLLAVLLVSACGHATEQASVSEAKAEPSPTSTVRFDGAVCPGEISSMNNDFASDAVGDPDPLAAASAYAKENETVELTKQSGDVATAIVIDSSGVATAELGMIDLGHGWLVASLLDCA